MRLSWQTERVIKNLHEGDYFGEISLILQMKRTSNVRARSFCELCTLSRKDFETVMQIYGEEREMMEGIIMAKYEERDNWERASDVEKRRRVNPAEMIQSIGTRLSAIEGALGNLGDAVR